MLPNDTYDLSQLPEQIRRKISPQGSGCWLWTAARNRDGYGKLAYEGRFVYAHRLTYELLAGQILPGLEIDHTCLVRACCNPAHMEVVSHRENTLRGNSIPARNGQKLYCPRGHEYTPANTMFETGKTGRLKRTCRTCKRERNRRARLLHTSAS